MGVRGPGEESLVWTGLCARFHETAREADRYGLGQRWRELLAGVRRGVVRAGEVRVLLAEVAELRGHAEDFTGRGDERWPLTRPEDASGTGFACPGGLCRLRVAVSPFEPVPRCAVLDRDMVDPLA